MFIHYKNQHLPPAQAPQTGAQTTTTHDQGAVSVHTTPHHPTSTLHWADCTRVTPSNLLYPSYCPCTDRDWHWLTSIPTSTVPHCTMLSAIGQPVTAHWLVEKHCARMGVWLGYSEYVHLSANRSWIMWLHSRTTDQELHDVSCCIIAQALWSCTTAFQWEAWKTLNHR